MKKFKFKSEKSTFLADTITPVSVYLRIRDQFPHSLLLESADYRGSENSFSFICCKAIAGFKVEKSSVFVSLPDGSVERFLAGGREEIIKSFDSFVGSFESSDDSEAKFAQGIFGYMSFDAIEYFEDIKLSAEDDTERRIPEINYNFYEFVIAFNHFKNEVYLVRNCFEENLQSSDNSLEAIKKLLFKNAVAIYSFDCVGEEQSNFNDEDQIAVIETCKKHIARGDIFQIVPSRRFSQKFEGDDFNVYRALRSINPSPYLFYFDYGSFRIFGSSPEAQLLVKDGKASIFPIAGTYPRRADRSNDLELAETLKNDPKENAEHVMLVDLARNDLSKQCDGVKVETFKEIHFYSHVIHLVSKVTGNIRSGVSTLSVLGDTFPAGTLSGAPKYRALQLIDKYEKGRRSYYGGCIGFIGLNGDCTHAIMIRSFLSKSGMLFYQAGAGIVFDSNPQSEVNEVKTKLGALKKAIQFASSKLS